MHGNMYRHKNIHIWQLSIAQKHVKNCGNFGRYAPDQGMLKWIDAAQQRTAMRTG
jgi:hypothetical protein